MTDAIKTGNGPALEKPDYWEILHMFYQNNTGGAHQEYGDSLLSSPKSIDSNDSKDDIIKEKRIKREEKKSQKNLSKNGSLGICLYISW